MEPDPAAWEARNPAGAIEMRCHALEPVMLGHRKPATGLRVLTLVYVVFPDARVCKMYDHFQSNLKVAVARF